MRRFTPGALLAWAFLAAAEPACSWVPSTVFSRTFTPLRWPGAIVAVRVNAQHGPNVTGSNADVLAGVNSSLDAWRNAGDTSLSLTNAGASTLVTRSAGDRVNTILFADSQSSGQLGGALAVCFTMFQTNGDLLDADIVFNTGFNFFTAITDTNRFDLGSVATHEIGHLLGLDHSSVLASTMFQSHPPGEVGGRTLSDDDKAGVRVTYPPSNASSIFGSIGGRVRLGAGGVLGAIVFAIDTRGVVASSGITLDSAGTFAIRGLRPGTYMLAVEPLDGPVAQPNLGGYFQAIGAFTTGYLSRPPMGSFTVQAGRNTPAGDIAMTAGTPRTNPGEVIGLALPGQTFFSFNTSVRIPAGATDMRLVVIDEDGLDTTTQVAISGGDVTLTPMQSMRLSNGKTFRMFGLAVPSSASSGARNISFATAGETTFLQGAFDVEGGSGGFTRAPGCEDVNRDGSVSIIDLRRVLNVVLGSPNTGREDINGDGAVSITDLRRVTNVLVGIAQPSTCP